MFAIHFCEDPALTAFKMSLPGFALGSRRGAGPREARKTQFARSRVEPLPPILALEGEPDPSLRRVIEELAERLGASICAFDGVRALAEDPDLDAVVAVVLAPRPLSNSFAGVMPLDPAFVAPPLTVERLLFALEPRD